MKKIIIPSLLLTCLWTQSFCQDYKEIVLNTTNDLKTVDDKNLMAYPGREIKFNSGKISSSNQAEPFSFSDTRALSQAVKKYCLKNNFSFFKNKYRAGGTPAYTGLGLLFLRISYLYNLMKTQHIAGFKLSTQKTIFGMSARSCKKVNGLTFCLPIGK